MYAIYCGPPPLPGELWRSWNLDPALLLALAIAAIVLRRSGPGLAAVAVLVLAFVSPLCALSSALFSARVVHHVLLVAVAAPLLALALPRWRHGRPGLAFAVSTAALWAAHIPAAYDAALGNVALYWLTQLSLLGSALWFWRAVFEARDTVVESVGLVVAGFAQMGLLGALLTFAPNPLYAAHLVAPNAFGLTALEDQVLGGLVMWVPAGVPYAIAAAVLARRGWSRLRADAA